VQRAPGLAVTLICGIAIGLGLAAWLYGSGERTVAEAQLAVLQRHWSSAGQDWPATERMLRHGSRKLLADIALRGVKHEATEDEIRGIYGPPDAVAICGEKDLLHAAQGFTQCKIVDGKTDRRGYYAYKLGKFGFLPDSLSSEVLIINFDAAGRVFRKSIMSVQDDSPLADLSDDSRTERRIAFQGAVMNDTARIVEGMRP
jgi:hypothetical protein